MIFIMVETINCAKPLFDKILILSQGHHVSIGIYFRNKRAHNPNNFNPE